MMKDKQILLTGGTGGLGMGVLPAVLAQGATVTVPYRRAKEIDKVRDKLDSLTLRRTIFVQADLTVESQVAQLVSEMERVDGLIHLVGMYAGGDTAGFSLADWQTVFDINLVSTFLLCKHCLKRMQQQNYGRIVTVGSRGAVSPEPTLAAYSAAKAGVVALTQAIAKETKGTNITANVVLPSVIDTPANREAMGTENVDQWVKPESLAEIICFLASEAARDVRGAAIPVYGDA